jgi:hypothetical protein
MHRPARRWSAARGQRSVLRMPLEPCGFRRKEVRLFAAIGRLIAASDYLSDDALQRESVWQWHSNKGPGVCTHCWNELEIPGPIETPAWGSLRERSRAEWRTVQHEPILVQSARAQPQTTVALTRRTTAHCRHVMMILPCYG